MGCNSSEVSSKDERKLNKRNKNTLETTTKNEDESNTQKYYFKSAEKGLEENEVDPNLKDLEQRVSLTISLSNIVKNTNYYVELIMYTDSYKKNKKSLGTTEKKSGENNIEFEEFFTLPYYFECQQYLDFIIYYENNSEKIETTLGKIVGSRKHNFERKLENGEEIKIISNEIKKSKKIINFEITIINNSLETDIVYNITNLGTMSEPQNKKLYQSEKKNSISNKEIKYKLCQIPLMLLNSKGKEKGSNILIEIIDKKNNQKLGEFRGELSQLLIPEPLIISLNDESKVNIKTKIVKNYSFISYLKLGVTINLTIGIDFTFSNGSYKDSFSNHYLYNGLNDYEKAIKSCGDILAHYDNDQLFPVFGFGFQFLPELKKPTNDRYGLLNYPINGNLENPDIKYINNVLKIYRKFIPTIELAYPTNFAPLIKDLIRVCKENIEKGDKMSYNILMILTDGQIDDMDDTKNALVEASFLPISVIIIGIGKCDFSNMDILDADENPLIDNNGKKADRDLVQFVPYNKYKDDPSKLAEQVLEEIPTQIVEYYHHNNIYPPDVDSDDE